MEKGFDLKLFVIVLVILGALTLTVTSAMETVVSKDIQMQEQVAPPTQPIRQFVPQGVPQGSAGGCGI